MLRELAETVEVLTVERPLVLVFEDLQWSDTATLEWLAYVARRRDPARLLILGTYRSVETIERVSPLRQVTRELLRQDQCTELTLDYLSQAAVDDYLTQRFGGWSPSHALSQIIHQRSNGNPLFMILLVDEIIQQGCIRKEGERWTMLDGMEMPTIAIPASIRQLIEHHFEQLHSAAQEVLEAASVIGAEFTAAATAAALGYEIATVESHCAALARRGQLIAASATVEWPDGTITTTYRFIHALYQEVLYDRVPSGQQARWHGQIGARLERGYQSQAREKAAELAVHFIRGQEPQRGLVYLQYAGENALRRGARQEAQGHLEMALNLLKALPQTSERVQQELQLHLMLGSTLMATKGYASGDVVSMYTRAQELCQHVGDAAQRLTALRGLWSFYFGRGEYQTARELGTECLALAQRLQDPRLLLVAHRLVGMSLFFWASLSPPDTISSRVYNSTTRNNTPPILPSA